MNIYKITSSSHGRTLEIIAQADTMQDAIEDFKQANKNAFTKFTEHNEINTEGEVIKCEKLEQLFAGFKGVYYM